MVFEKIELNTQVNVVLRFMDKYALSGNYQKYNLIMHIEVMQVFDWGS